MSTRRAAEQSTTESAQAVEDQERHGGGAATLRAGQLGVGGIRWFQSMAGNAATARLLRREDDERPEIDQDRARRYNRRRKYPAELVDRIETAIGAPVDGVLGVDDAETVADWQHERGLGVDGMVGPKTLGALGLDEEPAPEEPAAAPSESAVPEASAPATPAAAPEPVEEVEAAAPAEQGVEEEEPEPAPGDAVPALAPEDTEADDFSAAVTAATEGVGDKGHQKRAEALVTAAREYVELYPKLVERYVAQPEPDTTEKVRVLGEASAALSRMEMLLGTIYHKNKGWEDTKRVPRLDKDGKPQVYEKGKRKGKTKMKTLQLNKGHMVDYYTNSNPMAWCSRFATTAIKTLVGGKGLVASSGLKIAKPKTKKWSHELDYSEDEGGALVGTRSSRSAKADEDSKDFNIWLKLMEELEPLSQEKREEHANAFLDENIRPQAGDLLVMTRSGKATGSYTKKGSGSHTLMVERLTGLKMSVVEGNKGSKATGRTFDLSDPSDVGQIIFIARPSLETYRAGEGDTELGGGEVTENDLKRPIAFVNAQLLEVAKAGGWVKADAAAGDVVADIVKGKTGNSRD